MELQAEGRGHRQRRHLRSLLNNKKTDLLQVQQYRQKEYDRLAITKPILIKTVYIFVVL